MNAFLQELCAWLDADRLGKKVLFVRNMAVGKQLLRMTANYGSPAVNVTAVPVRVYINQLLEGELVRRGLQKIDSVTASIALQRIMREVGGDAFTTMGKVELTTASKMLPQLEELEVNGICPADLERLGQSLLARVWDAYQSWKKENGFVLVAQMEDLNPLAEDARFAALSNVCLSKMEQEFLSRIPADRLTVIRFSVPAGADTPRNMLGAGVDEADSSIPVDFSPVSCVECQDVGTEIRAAFQRLFEEKVPGEDTVLVCPDDDYAMRVEEEGKLLGVPVDSAFGRPASMTNTAQLIRCLLEWATSDYDVEALTPALVSGSMGVFDEEGNRLLFGPEMLTSFRTMAVGWDKERWEMFCSHEKERYALAVQSVYAWVQYFEAPARPVREVAASLAGLLLASMRRGNENDLYLNIVDEVSRVYPGEMTGRDFLEIVQEIADGMRVDSHPTDMPGRLYCCSYENAVYVDRSHFILLGMSWDVFNKLGAEFPLLHDDEKQELSPHLRQVSDGAAEKRYAVLELLANRQDASVVFSRARSGYIGGEEIMAAGIFDDAAAKYRVTDPETGKEEVRVPQVTILGRKALTESDVRMKDGYVPRVSDYEMDEGRPEAWNESFENRVWSATGLELALECPRRFVFLRHMDVDKERPAGLERFGTKWLAPANRGNLVHQVLDQYFHETMPRVNEVDEALLRRLVDEGIEEYHVKLPVPVNLSDVSPEVATVRKIVGQVASKHASDTGRQTVGTEVDFGEPEPIRLEFGPFTIRLRGRIDRVDRVADGIEIIDYKTGNPYHFRRDFDDKLQYYLYALAWEKLHPDQTVVRASYELLDGPGGAESVTVEMTPERRGILYQRMVDLLTLLADPDEALLPAQLTQKPDGTPRECSLNCPFRNICAGPIGQELYYLPPDETPVEDEE